MTADMDRVIREAIKADAAALERACEAALQTGTSGVRVIGRNLAGPTTYEVTDEVPYGEVHEYPWGMD